MAQQSGSSVCSRCRVSKGEIVAGGGLCGTWWSGLALDPIDKTSFDGNVVEVSRNIVIVATDVVWSGNRLKKSAIWRWPDVYSIVMSYSSNLSCSLLIVRFWIGFASAAARGR